MQNVFEIEKSTTVLKDKSYLISYPYIASYFNRIDKITPEDIVRGAHMVYGWMPTILDLYPGDKNKTLEEISVALNKAKSGELLNSEELSDIASIINNSLVGASKLLHFINPEIYPIWDSKIYTFIHQKRPHNYRVNNPNLYLEYINLLNSLIKSKEFNSFHESINDKIGYNVTSVRAIELVMFLNSPSTKVE